MLLDLRRYFGSGFAVDEFEQPEVLAFVGDDRDDLVSREASKDAVRVTEDAARLESEVPPVQRTARLEWQQKTDVCQGAVHTYASQKQMG